MTEAKNILTLFRTPEQVTRLVQKVIAFQNASPEDLRREVEEYVVTEHIEESIRDVLEWIDTVRNTPGAETGAWVSGFYGSGKSSFAKYLGFAFDRNCVSDGIPFADRLATRIERGPVAQRLKVLSRELDAAVVMLDLASQSYTNLSDVSDVLYAHTLKTFGYCSGSIPIAEFEMHLEETGRYEAFLAHHRELYQTEWTTIHNRLAVSRIRAKKIAKELWPDEDFDLGAAKSTGELLNGEEKAQRIVDIVRRKTGKKTVIFVIDEVGQYLGARPAAILDMDGLAKNLRNIGRTAEDKIFVFATAQQMLTATSVAAINSAELYKLKDRFPKAVTLESNDIKEICVRRLLEKSSGAKAELQALFESVGAGFTTRTKLKNCETYETHTLSAEIFANLYPFTPQHFQILLSLLTELSVSTGGVGLRSAIRVIQDVLIKDRPEGRLIDAPVGRLVAADDFFDDLKEDIRRSTLHNQLLVACEKTIDWCSRREQDAEIAIRVAKALTIANILKDFPATAENIAALLQRSLTDALSVETVRGILEDMNETNGIPVSRSGDDSFHYLSNKLVTLDEERRRYVPYLADRQKLEGELMRTALEGVSPVRTAEGLSVKVELWQGGASSPIADPGAPVQLELQLCDEDQYDQRRQEAISATRQNHARLILLARWPERYDEAIVEILRSRHMADTHGQDADLEVSTHAADQRALADHDERELRTRLQHKFSEGELVSKGTNVALNPAEKPSLAEKVKARLSAIASDIFSKYWMLENRTASTDTARRFITKSPGQQTDEKSDPLELVTMKGNSPVLDEKPVVKEILSWLDAQTVALSGTALYAHFRSAPYGWSSEMVLYLLAVLFWAGKVDFMISGVTYRTTEQAVIDKLRAPRDFNQVTVSLRRDTVSQEDLIFAASFLSGFGASGIVYTNDGLTQSLHSVAADKRKNSEALLSLVRETGVYGEARLQNICAKLDRLERMAIVDFVALVRDDEQANALRMDLGWLTDLENGRVKGIFDDVRATRLALREVASLPESIRATLRPSLNEVENLLAQPDFMQRGGDLRKFALAVTEAVKKTGVALLGDIAVLTQRLDTALQEALTSRGLTSDESETLRQAFALYFGKNAFSDKTPLVTLFQRKAALAAPEDQVNDKVREILRARPVAAEKKPRTLQIARRIRTVEELSALIRQLRALESEMDAISEIDVTLD